MRSAGSPPPEAEQGKLNALAATVGLAVAAGDVVRETLTRCAEDAVVRHLSVALVRVWTIGPERRKMVLVLPNQRRAGHQPRRD